LVIILAGILVRAKYALWATVGVTIILACAQISLNQRIHIPNEAWTTSKSSFGDVIGYSMGFSIIAVVSWLYGTQMERSLRKATEAEAALELEKASLEIKVAQRTAALEQTRIEELEQAYKFAELGSLSTALLHDLANYLTVLTMDIKDLHGQHDSVTLTRAQETIGYIDKMVDDVRDQMSGTNTATTFSVTERISAVVGVLNHKAHQQAVSVAWQAPFDKLTVHGDATRFNQMIAIILGNAIDASSQRKSGEGAVTVTVSSTESQASIAISNNGPPLTEQQKQMLFKPFQSTKKHGMGIGLFLAKQMAERHFAGSIELDSDNAKTTFRIIVPKHV